MRSTGSGRPLFRLDPGWLFLLPGAALIAATLLIPAWEDVREARHERNRILLEERFRAQRLEHYAEYLDAAKRQEPGLILALTAAQLNELPGHLTPIVTEVDGKALAATPFADLEPTPPIPAEYRPADSTLARWTMNDRIRPWLFVAGAAMVLTGVLPAARR